MVVINAVLFTKKYTLKIFEKYIYSDFLNL